MNDRPMRQECFLEVQGCLAILQFLPFYGMVVIWSIKAILQLVVSPASCYWPLTLEALSLVCFLSILLYLLFLFFFSFFLYPIFFFCFFFVIFSIIIRYFFLFFLLLLFRFDRILFRSNERNWSEFESIWNIRTTTPDHC